jgi:Na+(H+)/acetate symporter ActP
VLAALLIVFVVAVAIAVAISTSTQQQIVSIRTSLAHDVTSAIQQFSHLVNSNKK